MSSKFIFTMGLIRETDTSPSHMSSRSAVGNVWRIWRSFWRSVWRSTWLRLAARLPALRAGTLWRARFARALRGRFIHSRGQLVVGPEGA